MKAHFLFSFALVVSAVTLVSCSSKNSAVKYTDLTKCDLKGKVKEVHIKNYDAKLKFGEITKTDLKDSTLICFNEDGMYLKVSGNKYNHHFGHYFWDGSAETRYSYSNDTTFIETMISSKGQIDKRKCILVRDAQGKYLSMDDYADYRDSEHITWTYDDNGLLKKISSYIDYQLIYLTKILEHDRNGLATKQVTYDKNGDLESTVILSHLDRTHLLSQTYLNQDGEIQDQISWEYDNKGNLIKTTMSGRWYDEEEITEYSYKYDNKGNYIEKISSSNGKYTIEERTIVYY